MILVELFTKDGCHLCEVVKAMLVKVKMQHAFDLQEIRIQEGDASYDEFKERIPVVHINHEFAFKYRVSEDEFLQKLRSASKSAG